ncbi:hypothetical protein BSKO_12495 [Bryopsis sp. KO-2023]|nr:hypothetical protein BSKO_12495 [Bryopsis sp. KO-2023]
MALARKSQMLQASFCLFALVAFSSAIPSVADSLPSSLELTTARSLLQDSAAAPAPFDEDTLDDLELSEPSVAPAEGPADEPETAESPDAASPDADSPAVESLDADGPTEEVESAESPSAESPISGLSIASSPLSATGFAESPSGAASAVAAGPAAETPIDDLEEVISQKLDESVDEAIIIDSAAGVGSMGALVIAVAFSAAVGLIV